MSFRRKSVRLVVVLAVSAFAAIPAQAFWYSVHGSAGFVEAQTELNVASVRRLNWGIEVKINKGGFAWIAFPLTNPNQNGIYADKIQFQWKTSSSKVAISSVFLVDGHTSFYNKKTNFPGSTAQPKTTTMIIPKTQKHFLENGVGIIIEVMNRSNKDETITFGSVGVNLEED